MLVTSCFPNEGKSDVTFQLAREIGNMGKRVLFIDADIRKSNFISRYQVRRGTCGLSQYLSGQWGLGDIVYQTDMENLSVIFSGPYSPNPAELLEEEGCDLMFEALRISYDYIIIDTPPMAPSIRLAMGGVSIIM